MILADKISELRRENGMSQEDLAEKLDVSRQSVSKWESGNSIPDLDKILKLSEVFAVSTDYLLKDDALPETSAVAGENERKLRSVSLEEAGEYMDVVTDSAKKLGRGVALCVLSPVVLMLCCGLAVRGTLSDGLAAGIGVVVLLAMVALGVLQIISVGMKLDKYKFLEESDFSLDYGVRGIVEKRRAQQEDGYRKSIAAGVAFCIVSAIPLIVAGCLEFLGAAVPVAVGLLLILVACGVYLFVSAGSVHGSFQKLLQEGDYTPERKATEKRTAWFSGAYWPIVTALYLAVSFLTYRWDRSWIIWPVAAVAFVGLKILVDSAAKRK